MASTGAEDLTRQPLEGSADCKTLGQREGEHQDIACRPLEGSADGTAWSRGGVVRGAILGLGVLQDSCYSGRDPAAPFLQ